MSLLWQHGRQNGRDCKAGKTPGAAKTASPECGMTIVSGPEGALLLQYAREFEQVNVGGECEGRSDCDQAG